MKENFEKALESVLHHEGGFVNHPKDPGGITNLGCTKRVWEEWVGHPVTEQNMRDLKAADVAPLYKQKYWDKVSGDYLPAGVDYAVFDTAINSGPGRAVKMLQACVNVEVDGVLGPNSLKAVNAFDVETLISDYSKRRLSFLTELSTWPTFGKGWERRVNEVADAASEMTTA
jgi:lysozyme family protein